MGIELLGSLRVDGDDVSLQRRDQVVLSALAVRPGDVLTADQLAEALWGEAPPPSWPKQIHGSVLRVRRALGPTVIETTAGGYRLAVVDDELDRGRFEELVARGDGLAAVGELDRAAVAYSRALELWRGPPFDVLDGWSPARIEAARLEEVRLAAEEGLLDARLASGEHREVVAVAEARVAEQPLREHRWAILATALYRCGRQADALRALKHARRTLVEQLGIEPSAELVALESAILRQDESLLAVSAPPMVSEQCPYKGLAPYDVDDSDSFFGRDDDVVACVERLDAHPLLVVTGPSGCGKSSLVRAGLIPALQRYGRSVAVFVPGTDPNAAMTNALASTDAAAPVLVVDQFEELFAGVDLDTSAPAQSFCARLAAYAADTAPVVAVVRADHLAALAVDPGFARLAEHGIHLVTPLAGDSLRAAIEGPAELVGLRLEHGLVDLLVRDCEGAPGALPLLSHALAETWQRRDGRVLTVEGYRATGQIRGAVARSADRLYESLPAEQRPKLRSVMLRLVSPALDGEPVRSRVATRALAGDADRERVLALLVRSRLVTSEQDSVELAHEALVRAWPRLRSWLDEDAAGQRILRHLSTAADGWESLGRPESELYRGARLDAALEWRTASSPDLTDQESAFLDASIVHTASEREALAERARRQARQNRRLRVALAAIAVFLVASLVAGFVAVDERDRANTAANLAERERDRAKIGRLVAESERAVDQRLDRALLLAVEARRRDDSIETRGALLTALTQGLPDTELAQPFDAPVASALRGFIPTGLRRLFGVQISADGRVVVVHGDTAPGKWVFAAFDVETRTELRRVEWESEIGQAYVDDAGTFALVAGAEAVEIYGLTSDTRLKVVDVQPQQPTVLEASLSPDGSTVGVVFDDGSVRFYSSSTGDRLGGTVPRPIAVGGRFADDGSFVFGSMTPDTGVLTLHFWDVRAGREDRRIDLVSPTEDGSYSREFLFSADMALLVGINDPSTIGGVDVWDATTGQLVGDRDQRPSLARGMPAFVTDRVVALGRFDGQILLYDLESERVVRAPLEASSGGIYGLAATPDGQTLVSVGDDGLIRIWGPDDRGLIDRPLLVGRQLAPTSTDGSRLAVWTEEGTVEIHAADGSAAPVAIRTAAGFEPKEDIVSLSADGARALILGVLPDGRGGFVADTRTGETLWASGPTGEWFFGRIAADGTRVVALVEDGKQLRSYDIATGAVVAEVTEAEIGKGLFVDSINPSRDGRFVDVIVGEGVARLDSDTLELVSYVDAGGVIQWNVAEVPGTDEVIATGLLGQLYKLNMTSGKVSVGRSRDITSLAGTGVSPDGTLVAAFHGFTSRIALFDAKTLLPIGRPIPVGEQIAPGFTVDGDLIANSRFGVSRWEMDPDEWERIACHTAGRNLTRAEWVEYLGDEPYRATCPDWPPASA